MVRYAAILACLLLGTTLTFAQGAGIGPQLGFYKANDADDMRVMPGAAFRLKPLPGLGIEASINYRHEEYLNGAVDVTSWPIMVTGLVYPLPIVYGAMGFGWYNTTIDYNIRSGGTFLIASHTQQDVGWHFGGGLELPLGSSAKLVGDIRYVFLDYDFQGFPGSDGVSNNFYVITAGLMFGL